MKNARRFGTVRSQRRNPLCPPAALATALLALGVAPGCSTAPTCTISPVVALSDAHTGQAICNATIVALPADDGGESDAGAVSFAPASSPSGCVYEGNLADLGPYTLTVSAPGYPPLSAAIRGIPGPCDNPPTPETIHLTIQGP